MVGLDNYWTRTPGAAGPAPGVVVLLAFQAALESG